MSNAANPEREEAARISDDSLDDICAGLTPYESISQLRDQVEQDLDMTLAEFKKVDKKSDPEKAKELDARLALYIGKLGGLDAALEILRKSN